MQKGQNYNRHSGQRLRAKQSWAISTFWFHSKEFCPEHRNDPKALNTNNLVPVRPDSDGLDVEEVPVVVAEPVAVCDVEHLQLPAYGVRRRTLGDEGATLRTG